MGISISPRDGHRDCNNKIAQMFYLTVFRNCCLPDTSIIQPTDNRNFQTTRAPNEELRLVNVRRIESANCKNGSPDMIEVQLPGN